MKELAEHEKLEIYLLEKLKNEKFLKPLVFVGGTMLRLCHELPRYSTDLDFWTLGKIDYPSYHKKMKGFLSEEFKLTDCENKFNTLLYEIRSPMSGRKLKIEIRKTTGKIDFEQKIAFSKHSNKQILLGSATLEQSMKNKLEAAVSRGEIRDYFDIEFMIKIGVPFAPDEKTTGKLISGIEKFKKLDFKVKLGSVLPAELRAYYAKNGFSLLKGRLNVVMGQE